MAGASIPISVFEGAKSPRVSIPPAVWSFAEFAKTSVELSTKTYDKTATAPAFVFGLSTTGHRATEDFDSIHALVLDGDKLPITAPPLERIISYLAHLNAPWVYTDRVVGGVRSFHVVIPFSRGVPTQQVSAVRARLRQEAEKYLDCVLDKAMDLPHQIMLAHTRRPTDPDDLTVSVLSGGLDLPGLDPEPELTPYRPYVPSVQPAVSDDDIVAILTAHDPKIRKHTRSRTKYLFKCPHKHAGKNTSQTAYFPDTGRIRCMAEKCAGKPLEWFMDALSAPLRAKWRAKYTVALSGILPPPVPRVSLEDARAAIRAELEKTISNGTRWSIVRVTTGAGKTSAAIQRLAEEALVEEADDVATPTPVVLATYSNKLVRQIASDLDTAGVTYRKKVGTLAVLDADGNPACKRHDEASALQDLGIDIVKAVCLGGGGCPYLDGCPAHAGRETGSGTVTLTNHALVPSVLAKGGHPRLVFDESPAIVEEVLLEAEELGRLLAAFERDRCPGDVWGTEGRVFKREVAEKLGALTPWLRLLPQGLERANAEWARLRGTRLGAVELAETPLAQFRKVMGEAIEHGAVACESPLKHKDVLATFSKLEAVMRAEDGGRLVRTVDGLCVTRVTDVAAAFRDRGGVILDATANVDQWRALLGATRPLNVIDLYVEDGHDQIVREMVYTKALTNNALSVHGITDDVRRELEKYRTVKDVMVFTYKKYKDTIREVLPDAEVRHFGEMRGSNAEMGVISTFITVGDFRENLDAFDRKAAVLGAVLSNDSGAAAELAQCHGRARDPINGDALLHVHYGCVVPYGWDSGNATARAIG